MANSEEIYKPCKHCSDSSQQFAEKYPHHHRTFFNRPDFTRRRFFEVAGAGLFGSYLASNARAADAITQAGVTTQNKAKNVIFILLQGAISQVDTFDLKTATGSDPNLKPTMINGINWPMGILPKLSANLGDMAIVRSMSAWALVHSLAQTWTQIGRNPVAALGDIAPNLGAVVAIEKEIERKPGQVFPAFVALNTPSGPGAGYFPASFAPFRINESRNTTSNGLPNTTNAGANNSGAFDSMLNRLHQYDDAYRKPSPYGTPLEDYDAFYSAARGLMYNTSVTSAFNFSTADSQRYGSSQFGNACLVAKQILAAGQGTRFIQINYGSWDMHQNIYTPNDPQSLYGMTPPLDNGVSTMLADLKSAGLLNETLVVMVGEFGRTPQMSASAGRDHFLLQSAVFAGAGVKGGKVIGTTSADGSSVTDFGWKGSGSTGARYVRPEDVEATIYSALGIDWTTVRRDDPFGRGFEYVPFASQGTYGPINELWS
jgi:hypothetical protein